MAKRKAKRYTATQLAKRLHNTVPEDFYNKFGAYYIEYAEGTKFLIELENGQRFTIAVSRAKQEK